MLIFQVSSPTQYFWYRKTLDISNNINEPEGINLQIAGSLTAGWILVYLCLAKGIASSPKVIMLKFIPIISAVHMKTIAWKLPLQNCGAMMLN